MKTPSKDARLDAARPSIQAALRDRGRVLRQRDLDAIFAANRGRWRLAQRIGARSFLNYLIECGDVRRHRLALPHRPESLYTIEDVPVSVLALAAKPRSYLTHASAMGLLELTEQVSKTIYINVEQRPQVSFPDSLTQESIDRAFRNQQRRTTNFTEHDGFRLMYINGRHTGGLGVVSRRLDSGDDVRVTDLDRTLIDIAIRPAYSGGVAEVLEAYRRGLGRTTISSVASMLEAMKLVYPYEQAIGFYLQRAGAADSELAPFRRKPMRFDFYLAHAMRETQYVPEWRLHVPKGL